MGFSDDLCAQRIKQLRKDHGMGQQELADRIGVGKTAISNYESGYSSPSGDKLLKICKVFDVQVYYLLGLTDIRARFGQHMSGITIPIFNANNIESIRMGKLVDSESFIQIPDSPNFRMGSFISIPMPDESLDKLNVNKNDSLIIKKVSNQNDFLNGYIYAVAICGKVYVRRLNKKGPHVLLLPESTRLCFTPIEVKFPHQDTEIIGQVVQAIVNIR